MTKTYTLSSKEFSAVSSLEGSARYEHLVKRVANWGNVWGLHNDSGWVMAGDDNGHQALAIWPHPDYASACAVDNWAGNSPTPIEIHQFIDRWLPNMETDGISLAVFPTPGMKGVIVPPSRLQVDLTKELDQYE